MGLGGAAFREPSPPFPGGERLGGDADEEFSRELIAELVHQIGLLISIPEN
jgi:hypothetical protein